MADDWAYIFSPSLIGCQREFQRHIRSQSRSTDQDKRKGLAIPNETTNRLLGPVLIFYGCRISIRRRYAPCFDTPLVGFQSPRHRLGIYQS